LGETPWQPSAHRLGPRLLSAAIAKYHSADGIHLILPNRVRVSLQGHDPERPMAIIIPAADTIPARIAGVERFRRTLAGKPAGPLPPSQRLTPRHRRRLIQMLKALDGRLSDATYREIAAGLFGLKAVSDRGWKTTPVRAQTIRLVNVGYSMMNREYLKLLRGS